MYEDTKFNFEDYCELVNQFDSCIDDYPFVIDIKNDKYFISEKALKRFNITCQQFSNVLYEQKNFVYKDDIPMLVEDLNKLMSGEKDEHNLEYRWLDSNLHPVWINCRGRAIKDSNGESAFLIGCINEIGKAAKADNVSGLLQSTSLKESFADEDTAKNIGFILRIGIDGFREINERFGNAYGDFILKAVAHCITSRIKSGQQVYHVVADEYMVVDFNNGSVAEAFELYREIRRDIDIFIEENNYEAVYTISGGIIDRREHVDFNYDTVMKLSEFALREAKNRGRNQAYIYEDKDYEAFIRIRKLRVELKVAVENNYQGFELFFQPITAVEGGNARLYGAESLLRFTTKEGERISPVEFIPILESSGLIIPVGKWILDKAASMCKQCQQYIPNFKVSVNLSYIQIMKSSIFDEICSIISKYDLKPENLVMEITESGYRENSPIVMKVWNSLKRFGVMIAIDDFGTGYSNIQSISKMMPDIIKLDRGFTVKALTNDFENELMNNVIALVHKIDMKICVEGIETSDQLSDIMGMDPNYIQGYYYGKPCSRTEFINEFMS